jgi:formylglycine-generating enzyme required for sulfatase activity
MRSLREGLEPCYDETTLKCNFGADGYRLPTEAEWEYACRAGTTSRYFFGDDPRKLRRYAWFKANAHKTTRPAGQKEPNRWGLVDMQGNVSEWCHDFCGEGYYAQAESENPRGPASGEYRVLRGGNWDSSEETCRSSARHFEAPAFADVCFRRDAIGFRCVRRAP